MRWSSRPWSTQIVEHYCAHQYTHTRPTLCSLQTYRRHPCQRPARQLPSSGFAFAEGCSNSAFVLYLIMHIHCHLASTFLSCEVMFLFIEESQRHCPSNVSQSFAATSRDCNYNCHPVICSWFLSTSTTGADNPTNVLDIGRGKRFSFDCRKWFNFLNSILVSRSDTDVSFIRRQQLQLIVCSLLTLTLEFFVCSESCVRIAVQSLLSSQRRDRITAFFFIQARSRHPSFRPTESNIIII